MKDMIKLVIIMAIFSILSALLLGLTYSKTLPLIIKNAEILKNNSMKEILNDAIDLKKISITENYGELYEGYSTDQKLVGYLIESSAKGYGGNIKYIISLTTDLLVKKIKILSHQETPGLGSKIEEDKFLSQFNNLKNEELYLNKDNPNGKINAITSATISSRALTNSLRNVVELFSKSKKRDLSVEENLQKHKELDEKTVNYSNGSGKKKNNLKDGMYSGKGIGYAGELVISVEVKNGKIINIITENSKENSKYYDVAFSSITSKVILSQSTKKIDIITGATHSSKGLLEGIDNALIQAKKYGKN